MYHFHETPCLLQGTVSCGVPYLHPKLQVRKVWQSQAVWFTIDFYPVVMVSLALELLRNMATESWWMANSTLVMVWVECQIGLEHAEAHSHSVKTFILYLLASLLDSADYFHSCLEFLGTCCLQPFLQLTQKSPTSQMISVLWAAEGLHEYEKLRIWERQHNTTKCSLYC